MLFIKKEPGSYLLSRLEAVSSAQGSLTSVFGMGTGISSPPWPPGNNCRTKRKRKKGADEKQNACRHFIQAFMCSYVSVSRYSTGTIIWSSLTTYQYCSAVHVAVPAPAAYQPDSVSGVFRRVIPSGMSHLEAGFPLRCFQRLSLPNVATRHLPLA